MEQMSFFDVGSVDVYPVMDEGEAVFVDAESGIVMGMLCFEIPLGLDDDPVEVANWLNRRIRKISKKYGPMILEELGSPEGL